MATVRQLLEVVRAWARDRDEHESEWAAPAPDRENVVYALVEPTRVCVSPNGHEAVEMRAYGGVIPIKAICGICGDKFDVVVTSAESALNGRSNDDELSPCTTGVSEC